MPSFVQRGFVSALTLPSRTRNSASLSILTSVAPSTQPGVVATGDGGGGLVPGEPDSGSGSSPPASLPSSPPSGGSGSGSSSSDSAWTSLEDHRALDERQDTPRRSRGTAPSNPAPGESSTRGGPLAGHRYRCVHRRRLRVERAVRRSSPIPMVRFRRDTHITTL